MNDPSTCTALVLYTGSDSGTAEESTSLTAVADSSVTGDGARSDGLAPRFVGLSNQGATCYMNSLLQTLYMTPEFRAALYEWKHEAQPSEGVPMVPEGGVSSPGGAEAGPEMGAGGLAVDVEVEEDPSECIPLQLQRLFGQLQLSDRTCVETRALTDSFGWTAQDSFQQHDVQELCRVLFDALESTFQGTVNEKLVNNLYQGSLRDYVTCKECHSESSRLDNFLDVSLVLRPFGGNKTMKSVTESLEYFLKPEVLDGDNQYYCQACDKKVDAVKGLKFERLPYLLSLQLKRFDFDYDTFQRIKLNDEMRFPLVLDMNKYVDNPGIGDDGGDGYGSCTEGYRKHHRSDFQRSVSLEKKKLQGLIGKMPDSEDALHGSGNLSEETGGAGGNVDGSSNGTGEDGVTAVGLDGEGASATAVGTTAAGTKDVLGVEDPAVVDLDTDETDKEEGSLDSGASTGAKGGEADLPELEDYWGIPFQDKTGVGDRKPSAFGNIGEPRGGVDGAGEKRNGAGKGVAWAKEGTEQDDPLVPEEIAEDAPKLIQENGPWVYELFAVLIHSGSALGGHYYAHIKSLGDDAGWFTFNDSRVTPTDEEAVKRAWGGRWGQSSTWQRRAAAASASSSGAGASQGAGTGGRSSQPSASESAAPKWGNSAANAYMVMYRRVDSLVNKRHLRREEVPKHVVREVTEEDRRAAEAEAAAEAKRAALASSIKVTVKLNGGSEEKTVTGDKRRPLRELVDRAAEAFGVPIMEDEEAAVDAPEGGNGDEERRGLLCQPVEAWVSKDCTSDGGETDRETQDESRSDDSAAGRGGAAGDEEEMRGGGVGAGRGAVSVSGQGPKNLGYLPRVGQGSSEGAIASLKSGSPRGDRRLVRLRDYLPGPRLPGAPLEEASSPAKLFFGSNKTLSLETREPGAPWPRFDRDDINVGVVRFDRAVQEVDKPDEASCRGEVDLQNPSRAGGVSPKLSVRGGFAPERITRMKASGTVREMRTQLATFAGTVAERTRVFTMSSEKPKSTYKVLCPPRSARRLGLGRRLPQTETPTAGGDLGADASARGVGLPLPPEILASEAVASAAIDGATQQAPVIGFTTAKALMDLEAAATPPPITRCSEIDVFSWGADQSPLKKLHEKNEGENGNDSGNGYGDGGDGCDVEDEIVVLGEQGSSFVHNVYVEEVPEEDDDARYGSKGGDGEREGENMSLAVQVALDQLNRISLKLQLTGGLEGPDMINVDKRWTSDQLRNAVAAVIGRDNRSFQLRKTKASAQEIRPGPETLEKLEFYDLLKLHVSPGRPLELYEEAITIAPLEVGFAIGLRAAPPPSVVKALAGGRTANVSLSPWQQQTAAGIGQVERAAPAGSLLGDTPQNDGEDSVGCKLGGCGEECAGGPEIGAETGLSSMTKGCASVVAATVAPFVPDSSSAVGSSGSGGAACSMLDREAGGFAAPSGADGDGYEESAIASALLLTLGAAMTGETGSSDDESATAPLLPTASPDGCVVSHPRALEVGSETEAADDDTPQASARPDSAACLADATPPLLVTAVWAAAAASAAAASKLATADTERLTTTFVEVAPQENCWREQFTMAVKRDSKVADIRCAVWQEMRRNGLVPNSSCGPREGVGEGEGDRSEPSLGRTPAALRLRDKRAKIPSTILRDSDGKPTRSRYGSQWIPRLLVTQTLPDEEDLGQDRVRALAAGGEDEKREEGRLAATTTCARGFSCSLPPADARVVVVQWWDRWEWRLTEKYEAWISPTETVAAARKRLAEQVGVDPANLRVNRCNSNTPLRLCDLRGPSDTGQSKSSNSGGNGSLGLGVASVESGGWDSTFNRACRWADFDVSHGNQPVGTPAVLEGDLLLLQDVSQPLKRLAAATEASIIDSGVDRASGDSWPASAAGCDMSSVGSWYAGSESVGNGNGEGGESTATVTIATTTASKSYSSFKPKERALRIRTRRDRLQEGKVASMAAAVAAGSASTQVAAVESLSSDNRALIGEVGGSASARATGFELGSPGLGAKRTSLLLYSGEKTIATDANGSGGSGGECLGLRDDRDDRGGLTSGDCTDEASGDLCAIGAVAAGGNVCASASDRARGFGRGKIEDAKIEDVSSPNRTEDDDVWGVELSEREAYAGLSVGHGNDDAITMHSDAEVAERGGRSQFDDLALVE